jgi:SAM-dependent methyltransferase
MTDLAGKCICLDLQRAEDMKFLDRVLQRWRIAKAGRFVPKGARVLDIGSFDGVIFRQLGARIVGGMGIDPLLPARQQLGTVLLVPGFFPQDLPVTEPFDVITMLAVLEHFPASQHAALREGCARFLKPGGRLIITVPSPAVDKILDVLKFLRLIHGMSLEEHCGFEVRHTVEIFSPPEFALIKRTSFQLCLNNLFVFQRAGPD